MPTPIEVVQSRLGVPRTGHWDRTTDGALLAYQSTHGKYAMSPTGHPDAATLANLGYFAPSDVFTQGWSNYLTGGPKPGTVTRDLKASIDQVPRWAWATVALGFSVFAVLAYRTDRKREKGKG